MQSEKFKIHFLGESHDLRTNRWGFKCKKCDRNFEPPTTMLAVQTIQCKCGVIETVNYNKLE